MNSEIVFLTSMGILLMSIIITILAYHSKKKLLKKLHEIVDDAINDKLEEKNFDESMISSLESKLNKYLKKNYLKAIELDKEKDNIKSLISDISHQTKTPIANIILYSSLLKEQDGFDEETKFIVNEIEDQGEKLKFLINALINSSRMESGIINLKLKKDKINDLISQVINSANQEALLKDIEIINRVEKGQATFDMKWTREALYNIIENAIKYNHCGGIIEVSAIEYEFFYKIDVKDSGIGISKGDQNKIFTRFYRAENVQQKQGVGIGLYLAKEILEKQGGYITVKSKVEEGSTFSLFLPKGLEES